MKIPIKIHYNYHMKEKINTTNTPTLTPLITHIKELITTSTQKIETEKIQTDRHIGKYIKEHLLLHQNRAEYGEYVFTTLIFTNFLYY